MKKNFHILNGDALKERFPTNIPGTQIILRECLVDGPVNILTDPTSLSKFYETRSFFLFENYGIEKSIYHNTSMSEIERIRNIPVNAEVYLWFEDDLFCQVNMWFVCFLLSSNNEITTSLVRPPLAYLNDELPASALQYGFGGLDTTLLKTAFRNTHHLQDEDLNNFAQLWEAYQEKNEIKLLEIANQLSIRFDFIQPAVKACVNHWAGQPTILLQEIINELKTDNFGEIFQAFSKRGAIYGFGDLQVKRLLG